MMQHCATCVRLRWLKKENVEAENPPNRYTPDAGASDAQLFEHWDKKIADVAMGEHIILPSSSFHTKK